MEKTDKIKANQKDLAMASSDGENAQKEGASAEAQCTFFTSLPDQFRVQEDL